MSKLIIEGGRKLSGQITPMGAKNEALQVICATLLTCQEVEIDNIPEILDVKNLIDLMAHGCRRDPSRTWKVHFLCGQSGC